MLLYVTSNSYYQQETEYTLENFSEPPILFSYPDCWLEVSKYLEGPANYLLETGILILLLSESKCWDGS